MRYTLDFPIQYIANPDRFGAIGPGKLYIGVVDGDPAFEPADRVQAYIARQNDTDLAIPQPIELSAGGVPTYLGSPVTLKISQSYSAAVLDKNGSQVYYSPKTGEIIDEINALEILVNDFSDNTLFVIENVAALSTFTPVAGQVYYLKEYVSGSGLGGSEVVCKVGSITPNNVTTFACAVNYVERINYGMLTVHHAGAAGNGASNDTAPILRALNFLKPTGGELNFPRGVYLTDFIDLTEFENITLSGSGEYSEFQYKSTSVIKIRSACDVGIKTADDSAEIPAFQGVGIVIRDMVLNGNSLAQITINMVRSLKLENVKVSGAVLDGIVMEGGTYPISLTNVVSQQNGRDGCLVKAPFTTVYSMKNCEFGFNTRHGLSIRDGSTLAFDTVLCQSNGGDGFNIYMDDPASYSYPIFLERLTFINCYSEANAGWGIHIDSYNTNPATFIGKIADLTFINCSFNSSIAQQAYIRGTRNVSITNSPYLSDAIDPAYNTIGLDTFTIEGKIAPKFGVKFPATPNLSTDPNTLDDYAETASFTPVIIGATTPGAATYSTQTGKATKIGNLVFFSFNLTWSAHTGTGFMRVQLNTGRTSIYDSQCGLIPERLVVGSGRLLKGSVGSGGDTIVLLAADPAGGASNGVAMGTAGSVSGSGFFFV